MIIIDFMTPPGVEAKIGVARKSMHGKAGKRL